MKLTGRDKLVLIKVGLSVDECYHGIQGGWSNTVNGKWERKIGEREVEASIFATVTKSRENEERVQTARRRRKGRKV